MLSSLPNEIRYILISILICILASIIVFIMHEIKSINKIGHSKSIHAEGINSKSLNMNAHAEGHNSNNSSNIEYCGNLYSNDMEKLRKYSSNTYTSINDVDCTLYNKGDTIMVIPGDGTSKQYAFDGEKFEPYSVNYSDAKQDMLLDNKSANLILDNYVKVKSNVSIANGIKPRPKDEYFQIDVEKTFINIIEDESKNGKKKNIYKSFLTNCFTVDDKNESLIVYDVEPKLLYIMYMAYISNKLFNSSYMYSYNTFISKIKKHFAPYDKSDKWKDSKLLRIPVSNSIKRIIPLDCYYELVLQHYSGSKYSQFVFFLEKSDKLYEGMIMPINKLFDMYNDFWNDTMILGSKNLYCKETFKKKLSELFNVYKDDNNVLVVNLSRP